MNHSTNPDQLQPQVRRQTRVLIDALTKARKKAGLSQTAMSEQSGLSRMTFVRMEGAEDADPQLSTVLSAAALLGLGVELVDPATKAGLQDPATMVHRGLSWNRLKRDSSWDDTRRETALAKRWEAVNKASIGGDTPVMTHLVPGYTQEQATAAATAVQWLGSDIGFAFLQEALATAGYEVVRKRKSKNA
jgi:DNA-binding XRE family transcriptional regulator